jgi:hypothetical protein
MSTRIAIVALCVVTSAALGLAQGRPRGGEIATFNTLPSLGGRFAEALAVDEEGTTIVITESGVSRRENQEYEVWS